MEARWTQQVYERRCDFDKIALSPLLRRSSQPAYMRANCNIAGSEATTVVWALTLVNFPESTIWGVESGRELGQFFVRVCEESSRLFARAFDRPVVCAPFVVDVPYALDEVSGCPHVI